MNQLFRTDKIKRTADFSPCRTWRYTLIREWHEAGPRLLMILLNPSTANEEKDDATNRRGIRYAMDWGYGSLCFCNLFAVRTPFPKIMKKHSDPVGPDNNDWIFKEAYKAFYIIAGWGNDGRFKNRDSVILKLLRHKAIYCLGRNQNGTPKHPLYCKADIEPELLKAKEAANDE